MSFDGERFGLYSYDDWVKGAARIHKPELVPFAVKAGVEGGKVRIQPGMSEHHGVTVIGHDWIPVLPDGRATIDRMVHTPALYIDKMRNVVAAGDDFRMTASRVRAVGRPALLVGGHRDYYHWLLNHVPRLLWALKLGLVGSRDVIVNDRLTPFQSETLDLLKVPAERRLEVADDEALLCPNLLVPTYLVNTTVVHPAVPHLLKSALRPSGPPLHRHIYINRRSAGTRRFVNNDDVEALMRNLGFESIELEGLTLQQQIDLFSGASLVVGAHGAGLTNIVFCKPGSKIVEIFTPLHKVTSMRILSALCKHKHLMLPAENVTFGDDGNPLLGDWQVDIAQLEAAILPLLHSATTLH